MAGDTLILDVGGRGLHDGRHLGVGIASLEHLLERDYGRRAEVLDPLQWNDTDRLRDRIGSWSAQPVADRSVRMVFISTLCTRFVRGRQSFIGLALSSSVQGRPRTMLPADDLLEALSPPLGSGVVLFLDLTVVPSRRNTEVEDVTSAVELLLEVAWKWHVDVLLCASPGLFDLAALSDFRPQELGVMRALKSRADRAEPFSVLDVHTEMTRRIDDLHGATVVAQVADRGPAVLTPVRAEPRFPDYIVDDLYSSGPGSRLDAIVELCGIMLGRSDEGDPEEARAALTEMSRTDPDSAVRAECLRALEQETRLTIADLVEMEICHPGVAQELDSVAAPEFVGIPGGNHLIGMDPPGGQWFEQPGFSIELPSFSIARTPVTGGQYYQFAKETGWPIPANWVSDAVMVNTRNHPVVYVSYYDAVAYCEWLAEKLVDTLPPGAQVSLPTELEWEAAARWPDGRPHPWGLGFDGHRCNTLAAGIGDVLRCGEFSPAGDSAAGLVDVIGNVWEWTESLWGASGRAPATTYPLVDDRDRAYRSASSNVRRVIRGAAYYYTDECSNSYTRNRAFPDDVHKAGGFRPVVRVL